MNFSGSVIGLDKIEISITDEDVDEVPQVEMLTEPKDKHSPDTELDDIKENQNYQQEYSYLEPEEPLIEDNDFLNPDALRRHDPRR